jgi:hypothetical protein
MLLDTVSVSHPRLLLTGLAVAALLTLLLRKRLRRRPLLLAMTGLVLLLVAAAAPRVTLERTPSVAILVDLSPSTRSAPWRESGYVERTAAALAPRARRQVITFGEAGPAETLAESRLPAIAADAILLFSDGHVLAPESLPPVYAVQPQWRAEDARIARLEHTREGAQAWVVNHSGRTRRLTLGSLSEDIAPGASVIVTAPVAGRMTARLDGGDAWPENDVAVLSPPLSPALEKWWCGEGAPSGYRALAPQALPQELAGYLGVSVIVVAEVAPERLTAHAALLGRYVEELGGSALLIAGETDYAAWRNTPLARLMPIAPEAPRPVNDWILLLDRSGSMAGRAAPAATRWQLAASAALSAARGLPAADSLALATFAGELQWVERGRPVADVLRSPPPLLSQQPMGSSNLEGALLELSRSPRAQRQLQVLVLTDAQVSFRDEAALSEALRGTRISVLALSDGPGKAALERLARGTGGVFVAEASPAAWTTAAQQLTDAAAGGNQQRRPVTIEWLRPRLPSRGLEVWNRAWLREGATLMAQGADAARSPLVAQWHAGLGAVAAAMTALTPAEARALADGLAREPLASGLRVDWSQAAQGEVAAYAPAAPGVLSLHLSPLEGAQAAQTALLSAAEPGVYRGQWRPAGVPTLATLLRDGQPAARSLLAGQAGPEFQNIGVSRERLLKLAERSGGSVVAENGRPLALPRPTSRHDVAWLPALLGALLLFGAAALFRREK